MSPEDVTLELCNACSDVGVPQLGRVMVLSLSCLLDRGRGRHGCCLLVMLLHVLLCTAAVAPPAEENSNCRTIFVCWP
jgi:hypothetical protein